MAKHTATENMKYFSIVQQHIFQLTKTQHCTSDNLFIILIYDLFLYHSSTLKKYIFFELFLI